MLATFAFDVCHDVYRAARESLETKIATLNLNSCGKYSWQPDRRPRLGEYVAEGRYKDMPFTRYKRERGSQARP